MNLRRIYLLACIVFTLSACTKQQNSDLSTTQNSANESTKINRKTTIPSVPTSATMRGLIHNPDQAIEAVYGIDASGVFTIALSQVTKLPSDKSTLQSYDIAMSATGEVAIPSGATNFWLVPFDPSQQPYRLVGGSSVTLTCKCPEGGSGCTMTVVDCKATCNKGTCSGPYDCYLESSDQPSAAAMVIGSALVVPAETIIFNGVMYE